MGTSEDKLRRLIQTKNEIKNAIIEKGGVVNDSTPFGDYAQAIRDISGGGGKPILKLNWELVTANNGKNEYNDGFIHGTTLNGGLGYSSIKAAKLKFYPNINDVVTSMKFVICSSGARYSTGTSGFIGEISAQNSGSLSFAINSSADVYTWNGVTSEWRSMGGSNLSYNDSSYYYAGSSVYWWVYTFENGENRLKVYQQDGGGFLADKSSYNFPDTDIIVNNTVSNGNGDNGSFVSSTDEWVSITLGGVGDASDGRNYSGLIDLLNTYVEINGVELTRPMEIELR